MTAEDVDDFVSQVRMHFLADGYAAVRAFEGRCSPATFFSLVIQRQLLDYRARHWGRFRSSAAALRLGPAATRLELLLVRDGLSLDEAVAALAAAGQPIEKLEAAELARRFPKRAGRSTQIDLEEVEPARLAVGSESIEADAEAGERRATLEAVGAAMRAAMAELPADDRAILRLHFGGGMSLAEIARSMGLEQRPLYRRLGRLCDELRRRLAAAGLDERRVTELLGRADTDLDFGLRDVRNPAPAPSTESAKRDDE